MARIEDEFGINNVAFWKAAEELHGMELIDMHESSVVKVSDQVLSNYLFYLCFFKERALNLSTLLTRFFPGFRHRIVDSLNPVMSVFRTPSVEDELRRSVDAAWSGFQEAGDDSVLIQFIDTFASVKPTETLLFIQAQIAGLECEPAEVELASKADANIPSRSVLSVLRSFKHADPATIGIVSGLLLDYLAKRPRDFPKVIHLLAEDFGFKHTSHEYGFVIEKLVLDIIWTRCDEGSNDLFTKLFMRVSEHYLSTDHHTSEPKGNRAITLITFQLPPTPELFELRRTIWHRLFRLYRQAPWREASIELLSKYRKPPGAPSDLQIITADSRELLPFMETELSPARFRDGFLVIGYLDFLHAQGVSYEVRIRETFATPVVALADMLLEDFTRTKWRTHGFAEYEQQRDYQLREYFAGHDRSAYRRFFEQCLEIRADLQDERGQHRLSDAVFRVLVLLSERNAPLYADVVEEYVGQGDPLNLGFRFAEPIMLKLVELHGAARARELLTNLGSRVPLRWSFGYLAALQPGDITPEHRWDLCAAYRTARREDLPRGMDFLLNYTGVDRGVVVRVTEILLERAREDLNCGSALSLLFNPNTAINKTLESIFADCPSLLGRCYILNGEIEQYFDDDGQSFAKVLRLDSEFLGSFIDSQQTSGEARGYRALGTRDYSFLWEREDHQEIMPRALDRVYAHDGQATVYRESLVTAFFALPANGPNNDMLMERQDALVRELIARRHTDAGFMRFLFSIATEFSQERQSSLLSKFLEHNKDVEAFQLLPLLPSSWGGSGSMVPILQRRVHHLEPLLPLLKGVELLRQKLHVEQMIHGLRGGIEDYNKMEFLTD
jgi:hypothetical protein